MQRRIVQYGEAAARDVIAREEARAAFRIVWSTLLASMAVVVATMISTVPFMVVAFLAIPSTSRVARFFFYVSIFQHCYTPFIYFLFFRDYRAVLYRFYLKLVGRLPAAVSLVAPSL
ncbi:hypothetical protein BV898_17422 [Hypsibius exemplaris]|uniref:Uncharacterized protein n=1 Tax=Hypsibius exemplaris TaxID=2072580 RepID=A0A9X6RM54_HYPEX|nr:hypothetical protein BV898_17422 [Hypsibius exemplaris]